LLYFVFLIHTDEEKVQTTKKRVSFMHVENKNNNNNSGKEKKLNVHCIITDKYAYRDREMNK